MTSRPDPPPPCQRFRSDVPNGEQMAGLGILELPDRQTIEHMFDLKPGEFGWFG